MMIAFAYVNQTFLSKAKLEHQLKKKKTKKTEY